MVVQRTLVCLAAVGLLVFQLSMAENITVGAPNGGWDTSTNLETWADAQNFVVGDNLIFSYTPNHDVLEVTEANYGSCTTRNPIATHTGGNTVIALTSPGTRYFICGTPGHCDQGMKITVDTVASATPGTPSSPSVPSAGSPENSPPAPPRSSNGDSLQACLTVVFGLMLLALRA